MKRALVTGATGMLGFYLVEHLLAGGWSVRALCRRPERAGHLAALGVELVSGDLSDAESVRKAARGCRAVLHAAAVIGTGGRAEDYRIGNVVGTSHVIDAASQAGARLVHVSSTAVFGQARYRDEPTAEEATLPVLPDHDVYGRTKQAAERRVLEAHRAGRVWATVVRPPVMYGVRDRQFLPRIGPVMQKGFFPLVGGGRTTLTIVHADSVADGAVRALEHDVSGGRVYHLTNDFDMTVRDLVTGAAEGLERRIRAPVVPAAVARGAFGALGLALRGVGRGDLAPHARGTFRMLSRDNPFTSARAREELGWCPQVRPDQGLPEAFRWWNRHGDTAGEVAR